jgi:hypothetical protein
VTSISHDQNFKNLFLDFPVDTLKWILPETTRTFGPVVKIDFSRQESKKENLSDPHLALDMPILYTFRDSRQLLLWLVEFQEDKSKFSIYKLLHYTTDKMEAYPDALVVPTVIFTDRRQWTKDVVRYLDARLNDRVLLRFKYVFLKLFDHWARDYFDSRNPVVKILLPKMRYEPEERWEVIRQAYVGLYQLASRALFEKYTDFIDIYAEIDESERDQILREMEDREETIMIKQVLKEEGLQEGLQKGHFNMLSRVLLKKYQRPLHDMKTLKGLRPEDQLELLDFMLDCDSISEIEEWIRQRKSGNRT